MPLAPYKACPEPLPTPLKLQSSGRNLFNKILDGIIDTTEEEEVSCLDRLQANLNLIYKFLHSIKYLSKEYSI